MSFVEKIYGIGTRFGRLFNHRLFKVSLLSILSALMFFNVMNVYAATDETLKVQPNWEGTKEFFNGVSGLTGSELSQDNTTSHGGQSWLNNLWLLFASLAPQHTIGGENVLNNPEVPADLKIGLVGITDEALAFVYENQPSVNVIAHLGEEWVPGYEESSTSLYAAEDEASKSGYESLIDSGIAPLWTQFRNIAYLAFVIVMMVIGFMIMFRSKIGGQLMVSVGNTIPSVVVSLILVTFSFAIAGIVIDLGGFLISLLYNMIYSGKSISIADFGQLFSVLFEGLGEQALDSVGNEWSDSISMIRGFSAVTLQGLIELWKDIMETLHMGLWGLIALIIGCGVVVVGAIKLLVVLYKSFFEILLNVILGPIKILMGTFPGQENNKINWFTSLLRNVLVFPIIYFIVNLPIFLMNAGEFSLTLPSKLTGANLGDTDASSWTLSTEEGYWGLIITFVFRVFVLFYAAQAPKFAESIIPVKETNKATADAMAGAKMSMSKAPLIGGLFK